LFAQPDLLLRVALDDHLAERRIRTFEVPTEGLLG
jgi:hypothetical protein